MGQKTSKQNHQHSSFNGKNYYEINVRAYAKWDHRVALASNNVPRLAAQEIQNFRKHNQTMPPSAFRIPNQENQSVTTSSSSNNLERKKPRYDLNTPKPNLGIRKSRSVNNLSDSTTFITAQQLLYDQSKRRRRNKSTSSQISTHSSQSSNFEKSTSSTNLSQLSTATNKRKKIPNDFTFVSINPKDLRVNYSNFI